jgi:hypothetical protein
MGTFWGSARRLALSGISLVFIPVLLPSVCSSQPKIPLSKLPLTSMQLTLPKGSALAPGDKSPLVVTLTDPEGKTLTTQGEGHGKVRWADLTVQATVVNVTNKGVVQMPRVPWLRDGKSGHIHVSVLGHPDLVGDIDVLPLYDIAYRATFSESDGLHGTDGTGGIGGTRGIDGSLDPEHPAAGGNGSDGSNGSSGGDGHDGDDGPPVLVQVALWPGNHIMLEVSVSAPSHQEQWFLVDPNGGSVSIASNGGSGGAGGRGGRGGKGGSGGIGSPNGGSGRDGSDGQDGRRGFDGNPGQITMIFDPQTRPFLDSIRLARSRPAPVLKEQPVAPLW